MPSLDPKKLNDKKHIKRIGIATRFVWYFIVTAGRAIKHGYPISKNAWETSEEIGDRAVNELREFTKE